MKADARFTTAIHLCLYLHYRGEELLSSQEMSESVNTNPVVIRRLTSALRKAGIVESMAGKQGGFYLTKSIRQINLWDIYQAVNDRALFNSPKVNPECPVSSNLEQLVKLPFQEAELSMRSTLRKTTIADLFADLVEILPANNKWNDQNCKPEPTRKRK